ncbi:glycosyltransferase [Cloacibacillus porcorum]|uniref:Glycosyltransferase 2-like domain-containing protein n=1 Tax=Cloacibacillus porcorum TaxID=1197717 RepID=A0A1B2I7R9_9BACT|nr:glycosyltransferase [Cloacibacillus porcorum]ANZ46001.1 hypothetical protein BED41_13405 [Cloacibacillus porcorum]
MSDNTVLLSICCFAYNHEKYIRETLDGFLKQEVPFKYEVIIHDDASTDSTQKIIREYECKYPEVIKPIYQKQNQYSQGVNIFCTHISPCIKGRYIALCEGDDYWLDANKLKKQIDFMEVHREYIATTHQCIIVNDDGCPTARYSPTFLYVSKQARVFTYNDAEKFLLPGQTATLVFRRRAIVDYNLSNWAPLLDFSLVAFLSMQGDIYVFPDIMSAYRSMATNGSSYSVRYKRKSDTGSYILREEIERKAGLVFGRPFLYKSKRTRYVVDAIVNYLCTRSHTELEFIYKIYKKRNILLLILIYLPHIIGRIVQKIIFKIKNDAFLSSLK